MLLHSSIYLRYVQLSYLFVTHLLCVNDDVEKVKDAADNEEHSPQIPFGEIDMIATR